MKRRRFLGMVAALAAATVGVARRPKMPEPSNLYGSRKIERPLSDYIYEIRSPVVFAQNDLHPNSVFSRIHRVDSLPHSKQVFCKQGMLPAEKVTGEIFICPDMSYDVVKDLRRA